MNNKVISKIVSGTLLCSMVGYTLPVFAYTKDETVYSKLDASGSNYKTIVSTHIENTENEELIKDLSDLLNVKNTSGDETFTQDGSTFTWNANKNDIYYQGESQKDLPIECKVKYELDGKEISANEIAGKSGKVKITLQYTNKEERTVTVNGKKVKMYVPFVVVAGTIVKNENNQNVTISNGKVIDDGTKTTVIGMAMPGLQESLGVSADDIEIPNNIEITMDATDFETNGIFSYVTPKVLEEEDINSFDKLDEVYAQVNTLQSSMNQIQEGANTLKDGAETYSEKSQEFNNVMNQVSEGVSSVNSNYSQIDTGITTINQGSTSLKNGAEQLNAGIGELSSQLTSMPDSIEALYSGSTQVLNGLNDTQANGKTTPGLVTGVNTIVESLQTSNEGLNKALENLSATSQGTIKALKANNQTLKAVQQALGATEESKAANKTMIENLEKQIKANEEIIAKYNQYKAGADTQKQELAKKVSSSKESLTTVTKGMTTLRNAMTQVNAGLGQLNTASKKLPDALNQLSAGSKSLVSGTKTLSAGANKLSKGSTALKSGIQTLDTSTQQLTTANGQLTEGARTLSDGATTLDEGIKTFNEQGIKKICNYINGDIKDVTERAEKLTELSKEYNNFTMLNEGNQGEVKFIMIVDSVKKQEESEQGKEEAVLNTNVSSEENN